MYAPFHSSRAVCTPGRCSGAWSLLFYKKGTCLSRGFHQLFTKEWGEGGFCLPCLPLLFCPPSPKGKDIPPARARRALFPGGEGGDLKFSYARGFAPCIPGIKPLAALTEPAKQVPGGGLPCLSPANHAFSLLFCPHPPCPRPGGKGENQSFLMQGASPLASPRLNPCGTYTTKGFCLSTGGSASSPGEGGPGEMELSGASDGGV